MKVGFSFEEHAKEFDKHINQSIRGYSDFVDDVVQISNFFIESGTSVVDIGSSSGLLLRKMMDSNDSEKPAKYFGIEPVKEFENLSDAKIVHCNFSDVFMEKESCSFVTSLMTIQFLSHQERRTVFNTVHDWLAPGGAFVFSEKCDMIDAKTNEILQNLLINSKREFFEAEDIMEKDVGLRFSMHRSRADELIKQALAAGFRSCETIWMNRRFVGFIAIK
ncbi:MAG: methyltransferase domain-containing protein [Culicoidibacterales bacterium]